MTAPLSSSGRELASFQHLGPDDILDAVESVGYVCDGHLFAMNSYENRVYQVGVENAERPLIAKFYRPQRWTDEAIVEEHGFTTELAALEIPVVAPLANDNDETLHRRGPYRFSLYPRRGGRELDLEDPEHLERLGRFVGRIHAVGRVSPFAHRPTLEPAHFGAASAKYLLENNLLPIELETTYGDLAEVLLQGVAECYDRAAHVAHIRLHGDLHPGNLLWADEQVHIVDFDDARMGPAIQDLWMFLSGERSYRVARLGDLLRGYTQFADFDPRELHLIEALRTLRLMHYYAWLARRWDDPAFPIAFPWFDTRHAWEEHVITLRDQVEAMASPPLEWHG